MLTGQRERLAARLSRESSRFPRTDTGPVRGSSAAPRSLGHKRGIVQYLGCLHGLDHSESGILRMIADISPRDVVPLTISHGLLSAIIDKVTCALEQTYQDHLDRLPDQERLNVDETGHKQNRLRMWTSCFRPDLYTLFSIRHYLRLI
jgi:hypothetical protein